MKAAMGSQTANEIYLAFCGAPTHMGISSVSCVPRSPSH